MMTDPTFDLHAINQDELLGAKQILKQRYPSLVEGYIEDAEMYVAGIESGIATHDAAQIAQHAHPLKSSSASFGLNGVAAVAKAIELKAKEGESIVTIAPLLPLLKEALTYAITILKDTVQN
tara:strand:+ start:1369 stop:1734 length:366 start_codon:yes stop_codon:yes gene_type:complete